MKFYSDGLARPRQNDPAVFLGLWHGACGAHEGSSRAHQCRILNTSGGHIYTTERHPELTVGSRVKFRTAFDTLGIEQLAVNVTPCEPIEPVAKVTAPEIKPKKPNSK
jgi:hypothetical protein